ncbi:hypothetical protein AGMMS50262_02780 [Bacteroidia bacterium]|nr:hypothetical protein AGMMS50262_02780 [Bacteroidia bacterium]
MATITLDYDVRNTKAQRTLDYILSMGFFKARTERKPLRRTAVFSVVEDDRPIYFASEQALAKDWLNKDEEEAWKNL